jgi:hypothetical protein
VRPRFDTGVFDLLRLSWCKGATDDETLTQFLGMPNVDSYTLCVDKILDDVRTDFTPPGKTSVRFEGGRIRFTTGSRSIAISAWETPPTRQVFEFTSISVIGSIVLPEPARPEWFGAVGDGVADDTTPVSAAFKAGAVQCRGRYTHNAPGQNYGSTAIFGDNPIQALGVAADWSTSITIQFAVAFANLQLRDVAILAPASQSAIAVSGTLNALRAGFGNATAATIATTARFYAVDSVLQARGQVVTSGDISLSNIIYSGTSLVNRETEAPVVSVRNLRIPTVPNAFFLATDADGDVFAKDSNVNLGVATADDFRTLELGAWKLIPGIVELTGTTPTLGTGVNGFSWNLVDNLAAAKTCIIPSGATTESNYFKVIGKGGSYEIVLNTSSPDTFAEGGTTLTINPPSKGVTSVELYRFGNVWYPIFGVL